MISSVEAAVRSGRAVVKVGGELSAACPRCLAPAGSPCRRRRADDGPHAERAEETPPEAWVAEGDLVLVRSGGGVEVVAELLELRRGVVLVRRWRHASGTWANEREVPLRNVRGPAPVDDDRTKRADEARKRNGGGR